jgi:hypothetical protein
MRETASIALRPRTQCEPLRPLAAVPRLTMRFPATEYVASLAMVRFSNPASPGDGPGYEHFCAGVGDRERRWSKQSKAARGRQWTKRGADPLREDQTWSVRHGSEQQPSATRFAAPSFFVCRTGAPGRPRRCAYRSQEADLKVGTRQCRTFVRDEIRRAQGPKTTTGNGPARRSIAYRR